MSQSRPRVDSLRADPALSNPFRHLVESFVLLAIVVTLFRCFAAEGYLISTGSMAPSLLGYHRCVVCPDCHARFARGAAFDRDVESTHETVFANLQNGPEGAQETHCPNCGRTSIAAWQIPKNEGDQLLVHKHAYEWRDPRRWEVIVFRNPADPRQAYVKRAVGLPGESLTIMNGNLYADGKLCRKPYDVQRAMRLLVSDSTLQPPSDDPDWQPRWRPASGSAWSETTSGFTIDGDRQSTTDWIEYRHWVRHGGTHESSVQLNQWPTGVEQPNASYENIVYSRPRLYCRGVFTDVDRTRWLHRSDNPDFQRALDELFAASHIAPVTDDCAYNSDESADETPVHEFMTSFTLEHCHGPGGLAIELQDGQHSYLAVLDFQSKRFELTIDQNPTPVRSVPLPEEAFANLVEVEFSSFDSQLILAVNGTQVCEPVEVEPLREIVPVRYPTRIGASGLSCQISNVRLYRDVYYTTPSPGQPQHFTVANESFFVLGDNSPVSVDSRLWKDPNVPRTALIGKPVVVHLPSKQAQIRWGSEVKSMRVPDFAKMRWVR